MAIYSPGYSPQSFYSYSWCLDTSATYNVTPDLINLDHYQPYQSIDQLYVGNDEYVTIENVGTTHIYTQPIL